MERSITSLLKQSFTDFELVISDNASTDNTEEICRHFVENDNRIRYIRQATNIGPTANFKLVLDEAQGDYFMWSACDDIRSCDFLEVNYKFLSQHPDFVASTSPNCFEGQELNESNFIKFSLDGSMYERFITFFEYCWVSHGIFYSLIRTKELRGCEVLGQSFLAADWAINLYLASKGKLNRTEKGHTIFGIKGISSSSNVYRAFRNSIVEYALPFYRLSQYVLKLTSGYTIRQRLRVAKVLVELNVKAVRDQLHTWLFLLYCRYIKPIAKKN